MPRKELIRLQNEVWEEQKLGRHLQSLNGTQRGKSALGQGLDLIVIERQQGKILQVLECISTDTMYLIGIQESEEGRGNKTQRTTDL